MHHLYYLPLSFLLLQFSLFGKNCVHEKTYIRYSLVWTSVYKVSLVPILCANYTLGTSVTRYLLVNWERLPVWPWMSAVPQRSSAEEEPHHGGHHRHSRLLHPQ